MTGPQAPVRHPFRDVRLHVVTGKGGTGKSHFSLALAYRLSLLGKKVWLVEIGRKRDTQFSRLP